MPACLESLVEVESNEEGVLPGDIPIGFFMKIHPCWGAWSCLYFEGQTGAIKNQPHTTELKHKSSTGGQKGERKAEWQRKVCLESISID